MGKRKDIDKAVSNIMKWSDRPEWVDPLIFVFDAHLDQASELLGVSRDELSRLVEERGHAPMFYGAIYEDFLSYQFPDSRNVIDDYLKRRGWRESVRGRRYLQELRHSILSLYEIVDVSPGHHCDVRDLVRGGKPFRVNERKATQQLVKWDRIAARVLQFGGERLFSGGILPFTRDASESLFEMLCEPRKQFIDTYEPLDGEDASKTKPGDIFMRENTPAFTCIWLTRFFKIKDAPLPEMVNREGEPLMFTETRFPISGEHAAEIARRLDHTPKWRRDDPEEAVWTWTTSSADAAESIDGLHAIDAMLEQTEDQLILTTNSFERTERAKSEIENLLRGLIGSPLSKLQTPEQLMAGYDPHTPRKGDIQVEAALDPAIVEQAILEMLDQHYHRCMDDPIPLLGNQTPRQCATSAQGREKLIAWLKDLENTEQRRANAQGQTPYDFGWMWRELGLTDD